MIPTKYYLIGFLIYTIFNAATITTAYKINFKTETIRKMFLIGIFIFYSFATFYVMRFVDPNASTLEWFFQSLVYVVGQAFFTYFYYIYNLIPDKDPIEEVKDSVF